jgi:phosphomannomutase
VIDLSSNIRGPDTGSIVLFDMDGTLTEPRGQLDESVLQSLKKLSSFSEIGIVTGSGYEYMKQQIGTLFTNEIRFRTHLLPCNGTIYYAPGTPGSSNFFDLVHECNMRNKIGDESFNSLMKVLIRRQSGVLDYNNFPLTGHFIDYRGSMINWCPIGRNASSTEREAFREFLKENDSFRKWQIDILKEKLSLRGLTDQLEFKLGGDTSIDIYPKGWDKTYALKHFPDLKVWFVGDRCTGDGNDKEIFDKLSKVNRAYSTAHPKMTSEIIVNKIIPRLRSN